MCSSFSYAVNRFGDGRLKIFSFSLAQFGTDGRMRNLSSRKMCELYLFIFLVEWLGPSCRSRSSIKRGEVLMKMHVVVFQPLAFHPFDARTEHNGGFRRPEWMILANSRYPCVAAPIEFS